MRASNRIGFLFVVASVGAVTVGVVRASAPVDQYESFDVPDTVVIDSHTQLRWDRLPREITTTTLAQSAVCDAIGSDWRVPTVKELLTLVDEDGSTVFENSVIVHRAIDVNAFPNTEPSLYCTSTPVDANQVWAVDFSTGASVRRYATDPCYVRCVRSN